MTIEMMRLILYIAVALVMGLGIVIIMACLVVASRADEYAEQAWRKRGEQ